MQEIYKKIQANNKEKLIELITEVESGDGDASKLLGFIYLQGRFIKKDINKGIDALKKSADKGDAEAAKILYKIFTSKKYIETYQSEAEEYGEIAGIILKKNYTPSIAISKIKEKITKNNWKGYVKKNTDRKLSTGSAAAINQRGEFLTNRHVVENCKRVVVRYNDMLAQAIAVTIDNKADVAVVKVDETTPAFLHFGALKPELGEKIYVGGYPLVDELGAGLKITDGLISGINIKQSPGMIQISASISSGNSGGPVVDEKNRLVGISTLVTVSNVMRDGSVLGYGINFATGNEAIVGFLRENNIQYESKSNGLMLQSCS